MTQLLKNKSKKQKIVVRSFMQEVFSFCSVLLEIEVLTTFRLWVIGGTIFFLLSTWTKGSVLLHSSAVGAAIMSDNLGRCSLAMQFKADLLRRPFVLFFWVLDAFFGSSLSGLYWCHCCFKKCYINTFYFPTYCIKRWRTGVWNFFK